MFDPAELQFKRLQLIRGIAATIHRGEMQCPAKVVLGNTDLTAASPRDATYSTNTQEVLILAADYKPTGTATPPEDADKIVYTEADQVLTVELRPPSETQECFRRWPGGRVYQVFGKVMERA